MGDFGFFLLVVAKGKKDRAVEMVVKDAGGSVKIQKIRQT